MKFNKGLVLKGIGIFLLVVILIGFIRYRSTFLYRTVIKNRKNWDILATQNTLIDGDYIGFLYENDYDINNLSPEYLSIIVADYYIDHDTTFYNEKNMDEGHLYEKRITRHELDRTIRKIFGPDAPSFEAQEVHYGCGRKLVRDGDGYIISSYLPDYCGMFTNSDQWYYNKIVNYYQEDRDIIIEMKVGFVVPVVDNDEGDEFVYQVYTNKRKEQLIFGDYDEFCFEDDADESCFDLFQTYKIILRKASNRKYYFYKISKVV